MYTFEKINDSAENFCHKRQTVGMEGGEHLEERMGHHAIYRRSIGAEWEASAS